MKKITHHLGRFTTFFKDSSLVIQLVIVASAIGIIAGTATVAAMVATPSNNEASTDTTTSDNNDVASDTDSKLPTSKEKTTDNDTTTPQASQTTPQSNNTQNTDAPGSTNNSTQQEPQTQVPVQPTYTDTYLFKSDCVANPQNTGFDTWLYTKCYSSSYTAWKAQEAFGTAPYNWGDPRQWPAQADNSTISRGTTPKLRSVGIQTTNGAGWSVWVEAVHDNNTIDISYYNFNNNLAYGTQYNVNPSVFGTYIYFGE